MNLPRLYVFFAGLTIGLYWRDIREQCPRWWEKLFVSAIVGLIWPAALLARGFDYYADWRRRRTPPS